FKLARKGIMGMNQRNTGYISRYNPRKLYPLVDNKLKTKIIAQRDNVTIPALIGVVRTQHDIQSIIPLLQKHSGFVIKPAKG
ncbi:sugar-transfer associated ATP-grasp domain-containing protein, partial [Staphylococcus pasteuri_A]